MKTPTRARIVRHGVEGSQYFQGHGVAFTSYTDCATGIGDTEAEAYADALESLAQSDWDVQAIEALLSSEVNADGFDPRTVAEVIGEDPESESELFWFVSVDVA